MYDAIVVGARCAGSATAMLLARAGLRVLVVDKASFPSDTLSTHYIHQPGIAALERWGLLDALVAAGTPAINRYTFDVGPLALVGAPPPADGVAEAYAPRRTVLDQILVEAARASGAEVRERFTVKELLRDGERVTGIEGRLEGGEPVTERASIVIGADGMRSMVAQAVGAPSYEERPTVSCAYYTYWRGVPTDGVELYPRPDRMLIAAPTNDGNTLTIAYWPTGDFDRIRGDIERHFLEAIDLVPGLAERVRGGERVERFAGSNTLPGYFRVPFGDGWALVGDAGYHKNPITAEGITDAFRDAELLAGALIEAHLGERPLADALAGYERARNEAAMPIYGFTDELASLAPPTAEMQTLLGALAGDQNETDRFFGLLAGTVPIPEFFAPDNVARIVSGATAWR